MMVSASIAVTAGEATTAAVSDEGLVLALAGGDDLALNQLMNRWQVPLRRFLYRYTQNEHDAYDLAQETFVRVYQNCRRFKAGRPFSPWMFQIALNLARSRARWRKRHPATALEDEIDNPDSRRPLLVDSSPADETLATEQNDAVRSAIAGLPDELREAVVLFEYEDKSHAEIAAIVRATPKAVETRLYRARQQLRMSLGRYFA